LWNERSAPEWEDESILLHIGERGTFSKTECVSMFAWMRTRRDSLNNGVLVVPWWSVIPMGVMESSRRHSDGCFRFESPIG
jgi:hypothetical protein